MFGLPRFWSCQASLRLTGVSSGSYSTSRGWFRCVLGIQGCLQSSRTWPDASGNGHAERSRVIRMGTSSDEYSWSLEYSVLVVSAIRRPRRSVRSSTLLLRSGYDLAMIRSSVVLSNGGKAGALRGSTNSPCQRWARGSS